MRRIVFALCALACSSNGDDPSPEDSAVVDGDNDTAVVDTSVVDGDAIVPAACIEATGGGTPADKLVDGTDEASVSVAGEPCKRAFTLKTTAALRDGMPSNPRTVNEKDGPLVSTRNHMFDALYALAREEAREDSVDAISDGAFNDGKPIMCPAGGCFETGRLWKYVWTRDTAYSVDLGLAAIDPTRARNSLEFKLSDRRSGGEPQIVQDTGSGGSYPVSTDRVVWALGANRLLDFLDGTERSAFVERAWPAIRNTIEHDRAVIFDDELYRGEQSFLDWREQSYPAWTATDTVHLGMSKALSTNVAHLAILRTGARLAMEKGDSAAAKKYEGWSSDLAAAIKSKLWLESDKQLSTYLTTTLDPAPVHRYDALGTALAVLNGVVTTNDARDAIASYPHLARGVPVIWPQQKETPIYHNRAMWPFVTAYFARAAKVVRNDAAVDHALASLMRGAALNLSNMENFEIVSGKPRVEDGAYSGPVVNSQRQLWSVAGYLSFVHDVVFGMQTSNAGIRFEPFVTKKMRHGVFANADSIVLQGLRFRGKTLAVVVKLPVKTSGTTGGAYSVGKVRLNGMESSGVLTSLAANNLVEIELVENMEPTSTIRVVTDVADYKNLFGPRSPTITAVDVAGTNLRVSWDGNGELASEVGYNVYRDGVRVASDLTALSWTDATATATSPSHCYAVESYFTGSKNHSQHSPPSCYWGVAGARVKTIGASAFTNVGGTGVTNHGKFHYENWGDPDHTLTATFAATSTGEHLLQVNAGNGAGSINSGITAGLKVVEVLDGTTVVARGHFLMPHLGAWSVWRDSSLVRANLVAGKTYKIVIKHDSSSMNMSFFKHFELYTGGSGGKGGAYSKVNIAELKILARVN
jgi:glycogen debranching enzyme